MGSVGYSAAPLAGAACGDDGDAGDEHQCGAEGGAGVL